MGNSPQDTAKNADSKSPVLLNAVQPQTDSAKQDETAKVESTKAEPLAPPPRPTDPPVANTPDYFANSTTTHLTAEPNPFEYSFAGGQNGANGNGDQTPGGTKLPSVAAITSPAGILGPASSFSGLWGSSLRSGPLSPAMLSGPQRDDYFSDGHHLRGGLPTPNESGLRSGLTPGGGGSMFPDVQTPNTTAIYNQLASGGATPNTLDFHRTAMAAAAHNRRDLHSNQHAITSQPQEMVNGMDVKPPAMPGQFDATDAANGLFLLANARNPAQAPNHYAMAQNMPVHSHPPQSMNMGAISQEPSPTMGSRANGSISTASGRGMSEMSEEEQPNRPNTRGKGKRNSTQISTANGRQKQTPSKPSKKAKANNGYQMEPEPVQSPEEEQDMSKDQYNANGKKMTDEEKRKNFLERNRVAALKCRQRKKQWLANLQQKVELFSSENDNLSAQISTLREEIINLKSLLMVHKDCPVSHAQGQQAILAQLQLDGYGPQMNHNPYGMAGMAGPVINGQAQQQQQQQLQQMQYHRRES